MESCPMNYSKCNYKTAALHVSRTFLRIIFFWNMLYYEVKLWKTVIYIQCPKALCLFCCMVALRLNYPVPWLISTCLSCFISSFLFSRSEHIVVRIWKQSKTSLIKWDVVLWKLHWDKPNNKQFKKTPLNLKSENNVP